MHTVCVYLGRGALALFDTERLKVDLLTYFVQISMEMTRNNRSFVVVGVCTPMNALLQGRTSWGLGSLDPLKIGWDMFRPGLKCHILSLSTPST